MRIVFLTTHIEKLAIEEADKKMKYYYEKTLMTNFRFNSILV